MDPRQTKPRLVSLRLWPPLAGLMLLSLTGCAAFTNPVADGVPVDAVPPELLGHSREGDQILPMNLLSQEAPESYRLDTGDVLGVYIEKILDETTILPTVRVSERTRLAPERRDLPSAVGHPLEVRRDGTLALPHITPVSVRGLSLEGAEQAVRKAYVDAKLFQPDKGRMVFTLLHRRVAHVLVFRRDMQAGGRVLENIITTRVGLFGGGAELVGVGITGSGQEIALPAYENDLLHALALTGGYPGTNAARNVYIYRKVRRANNGAVLGMPRAVQPDRNGDRGQPWKPPAPAPAHALPHGHAFPEIVEIPLRFRPGEPFGFNPSDIVLYDGDIVYVDAAPLQTFYTAGLLPSAEHILPRDYDLDVIEAVARVRGAMVNGAFGGSNLSGELIRPGLGFPSPRLLTVVRRTPDGGQIPIIVDLHRALVDPSERILVQANDVLILQESRRQALVRYLTEQVKFSAIFRLFNRQDALGELFFLVP